MSAASTADSWSCSAHQRAFQGVRAGEDSWERPKEQMESSDVLKHEAMYPDTTLSAAERQQAFLLRIIPTQVQHPPKKGKG
jgi:hypothetical protein